VHARAPVAGNVFIAVTVIPAVPSYICKRRSDHILIYHLDGRVITMPASLSIRAGIRVRRRPQKPRHLRPFHRLSMIY